MTLGVSRVKEQIQLQLARRVEPVSRGSRSNLKSIEPAPEVSFFSPAKGRKQGKRVKGGVAAGAASAFAGLFGVEGVRIFVAQVGRAESGHTPAPHQTVHTVFPHTAFRCSSHQSMRRAPTRSSPIYRPASSGWKQAAFQQLKPSQRFQRPFRFLNTPLIEIVLIQIILVVDLLVLQVKPGLRPGRSTPASGSCAPPE